MKRGLSNSLATNTLISSLAKFLSVTALLPSPAKNSIRIWIKVALSKL